MTTQSTCKREGCARHVFARGRCRSHYNSYIKSLRRRGSTLHAEVDTWAEMQKFMPGTIRQLAALSGISYDPVRRAVNSRHAAGEAHISDHLSPDQAGGARWVRVFAAGPGKDHVVSVQRKAIHTRKKRQLAHVARTTGVKVVISPTIATRWNLSFFNPALIRTPQGASSVPGVHP